MTDDDPAVAPDLEVFVHVCVNATIRANNNVEFVLDTEILSTDFGYNSNSVLVLIDDVETRMNDDWPPGGRPFFLPKGPDERSLSGRSVGVFKDWVRARAAESLAADG